MKKARMEILKRLSFYAEHNATEDEPLLFEYYKGVIEGLSLAHNIIFKEENGKD